MFYSKITDDMYMEYTEEDTAALAQNLLISAIPKFEFARNPLIYTLNHHEETDKDGNTYKVGAFKGKLNLEEVNIPASVTTIEVNAFSGCTFLKNVSFADNSSLIEIKESAFARTGISKITLPSSLQVIGVKAFLTSAIEEVILPASLTAVKAYAFYGCEFLSVLDVSAVIGAPNLGASAFEDCKKLEFTPAIENVWSELGANYKEGTKNA